MIVFSSNHSKIVISDTPFASGGEGEVRTVVHSTTDTFRNTCVKLYFKDKRSDHLEKKLKYLVKNPPFYSKEDGFMICWPIDLIYDDDYRFIGFIMPTSPLDSHNLTFLTTPTISKKLDQIWHINFDRGNGSKSVINRLRLILNLFKAVNVLHKTGKYVLMDFKPDNVLITASGYVSLIDMDSVQINDHSHKFKAGAITPEYIPAEYYHNANYNIADNIFSIRWDMFALGVIAYQILFGLHPYAVTPKNESFDGTIDISSNIQNNFFPFGHNASMVTYADPHKNFILLPEHIKFLFISTFSDKPNQRPRCSLWISTLSSEIQKALTVSHIDNSTHSNILHTQQPIQTEKESIPSIPDVDSENYNNNILNDVQYESGQNNSEDYGKIAITVFGIIFAIALILMLIFL